MKNFERSYSPHVVVETDENSVVQAATLCETQEQAIEYALSIAEENEYAASQQELREQLQEQGYITDGGWTVSVVRTQTPA